LEDGIRMAPTQLTVTLEKISSAGNTCSDEIFA
jgi:hypothetical protein